MKKLAILVSGLLIIIQIGCTCISNICEQEDLKTLVDSIGNKAEEAFLAGDIDKLLEYYCDDIISMPNFYPMVEGKENLKRMMEAIRAAGIEFKSLESTTVEAKGSGNLVYEVGTFRQTILMPGAEKSEDSTGKYVMIWRRQPDGKLKIAVEIYNSNEKPAEKGR